MAAGTGSNGRGQGEATGDGVAAKLHLPAAYGRSMLGLAAASAAITMAVIEPPPWLDRNAYFAALSGAFFAGTTQVIASVWAAGGRRHVPGRKLVVAAGLTVVASLLL